ncbi:MAG: glutamate--tRNA ligase [Oscillospiraceae bacterium]|nr:glutamate--tRNA ligase [Oscillospiraceae bacterium]
MDMKFFEEAEARIPKGRVRTRFAPSPTGYMHIGNLRTALYTYMIAKHHGGDFILRIEDTDQGRLVEGATDLIYRTLRETGLNYDEGPDIGGPVGPYIQSERMGMYKQYAELLIERGAAYRCFCEKTDHEEKDGESPTKYDGRCSRLSPEEIQARLDAGVPYVIRQKMPESGETTFSDVVYGDITVPNEDLDDQVLIKSDGFPTYNFANVIDDHLMGITHVVRGSEYLSSAPKYNLLYEAFGWEIPTYVHCSPVMKNATQKLSKRNGDPSYEDLINEGYLKDAVVNYVTLLGWSPGGEQEIFSLSELVDIFELRGISKSPAIFDVAKLKYINAEYIRAMTPDAFAEVARPYIRQGVKNPDINPDLIAPLLQQRCERLADIPEQVDFFDAVPEYDSEMYFHKKMKTNAETALVTLTELRPVIEGINDWTFDNIHDALFSYIADRELKNGFVLWPLRTALSGKQVTPGGGVEFCHILGKEESLARIDAAIKKLSK